MMIDAVRAIQLGFHIFPVEPGGKTPIRIHQDRTPEDAPWTIKWSEYATNDINKVIEWWSYAPNANIGIACKLSGLFVVDCDQPKRTNQLGGTRWEHLHELLGPVVDGETLYDQVAERYGGTGSFAEAFDTYTVTTGSGGKHYYYRWPDGVQSTQDSIVKGLIDVRGNGGTAGGYVLGEGSRTAKGVYEVASNSPIRQAPWWLIKLCKERPPVTHLPQDRFRNAGPANFSGLVASVRLAQPGNRNNALLWAARAMCGDGGTEEAALELLVPAALDCGLDGGERQAMQTIRSAYRLQGRKG